MSGCGRGYSRYTSEDYRQQWVAPWMQQWLPDAVTGQDQVRIGDQERHAAADALADHFSVGRLDQAEYDDRLDKVWHARTRSDLRPVFTDLPQPHGPLTPPQSMAMMRARERAEQRAEARRRRHTGWRPPVLALVLLALAAIFLVHNLVVVLVVLALWVWRPWNRFGGHRHHARAEFHRSR